MGTIPLDCKRRATARFCFKRTSRRGIPPCEPAGAGEEPESANGLDHHGARRYAAHVRVQFNVCCHGSFGDEHIADD